MYAFQRIFVIGPHQRIAEEPGVLREEIVRCIDFHRPQVLDGKDGRRTRIAFTKRVNLPDAGDEPREMRDEAALPAVRIRILALPVEIIVKRTLDHGRMTVCHRLASQYPFALAKIDLANGTCVRKHTFVFACSIVNSIRSI